MFIVGAPSLVHKRYCLGLRCDHMPYIWKESQTARFAVRFYGCNWARLDFVHVAGIEDK